MDPQPLTPGEWDLWHAWMQAHRLITRELDRDLQRESGISNAEFSVLVTLFQAPGRHVRSNELAESLDWEKSRVSHQLTRMETRGLVERTDGGSGGRRQSVGLTAQGRRVVKSAILRHGSNIRRHFLDSLTPEQATTLRTWSAEVTTRLPPIEDGETSPP